MGRRRGRGEKEQTWERGRCASRFQPMDCKGGACGELRVQEKQIAHCRARAHHLLNAADASWPCRAERIDRLVADFLVRKVGRHICSRWSI